MRMDIKYTDEERRILESAVDAANQRLEMIWPGGNEKRFFVAYIELNAQRRDPESEEMIPDSHTFLAADARETA